MLVRAAEDKVVATINNPSSGSIVNTSPTDTVCSRTALEWLEVAICSNKRRLEGAKTGPVSQWERGLADQGCRRSAGILFVQEIENIPCLRPDAMCTRPVMKVDNEEQTLVSCGCLQGCENAINGPGSGRLVLGIHQLLGLW